MLKNANSHRLIPRPADVRNSPLDLPRGRLPFSWPPRGFYVRPCCFFSLEVSGSPSVLLYRIFELLDISPLLPFSRPRRICFRKRPKSITPNRTFRVSIFPRYATIRQIGLDIGLRMPPINFARF